MFNPHKKQEIINKQKSIPFKVGESISVLDSDLGKYAPKGKEITCDIVSIEGDFFIVSTDTNKKVKVNKNKVNKMEYHLGINPFEKYREIKMDSS